MLNLKKSRVVHFFFLILMEHIQVLNSYYAIKKKFSEQFKNLMLNFQKNLSFLDIYWSSYGNFKHLLHGYYIRLKRVKKISLIKNYLFLFQKKKVWSSSIHINLPLNTYIDVNLPSW
jgi:hypothetical protein